MNYQNQKSSGNLTTARISEQLQARILAGVRESGAEKLSSLGPVRHQKEPSPVNRPEPRPLMPKIEPAETIREKSRHGRFLLMSITVPLLLICASVFMGMSGSKTPKSSKHVVMAAPIASSEAPVIEAVPAEAGRVESIVPKAVTKTIMIDGFNVTGLDGKVQLSIRSAPQADYRLERSEDGINFSLVREIKAATAFELDDNSPAPYYRVTGMDRSGNRIISKIMSPSPGEPMMDEPLSIDGALS